MKTAGIKIITTLKTGMAGGSTNKQIFIVESRVFKYSNSTSFFYDSEHSPVQQKTPSKQDTLSFKTAKFFEKKQEEEKISFVWRKWPMNNIKPKTSVRNVNKKKVISHEFIKIINLDLELIYNLGFKNKLCKNKGRWDLTRLK